MKRVGWTAALLTAVLLVGCATAPLRAAKKTPEGPPPEEGPITINRPTC